MVTAAEIREHYDSLALIYRTFWGDHLHHGLFLRGDESAEEAQINLLEYCIATMQLRPHARVLDVGCGHGGTAIYLAAKSGCQVEALTLSEKQAAIARENAARCGVEDKVRVVVDDADSSDFPSEAFDIVWTMESCEHFADKAAYFRRAAAAMRSGGSLLLATWTGSTSSPRVLAVAEAFLCPELQSVEQYIVQMEAAGLRLQSRADLTSQVVKTWEICQERARLAAPAVKLLPEAARRFVAGIPIILDAYGSGDLTYAVLTAAVRAG